MKFFQIAIHRPITTIMFFAAMVVLGLVSLERIPLQMLPDISAPGGGVRFWARQSMSPEELERQLIRPIESEIAQLPNVQNMTVYSWGRGGFCRIEFEYGTPVKYRIIELQEKLNQLRDEFPSRAVEIHAFNFETSWFNKELMDLSLKAPKSDPYIELIDVEKLRQRLQDTEGVANASVWGGRERNIDVSIMQDNLQQFGIPLWRVINTVETYANEPTFLGNIEEGGKRFFVRLDGQFKSNSEIEDVVVRDEGNIAVRHLGSVQEEYRSRDSLHRVNGKPAVSVDLEKEADYNPIALSNTVRDKIDVINSELPPGYELSIEWDVADEIRGMLAALTRLATLGVILSMTVLYLFIRNLRMAMIVCLVIPICIITTFNAMYFTGVSLNMISLLGLAVGIGTLIDSSIVVLENIFRTHQRKPNAIEAAQIGTREVGIAVFAFTITNSVVFLPVVFIEGELRLIFTEGALAIIYPMMFSMLVALTMVPMATSRLLMLADRTRALRGQRRPPSSPPPTPAAAPGIASSLPPWPGRLRLPKMSMRWFRKSYIFVLKGCLRHRVRFLLAIALVIGYTAYYMAGDVNRDILQSPEDEESFRVYVFAPIGSKQEYTSEVVASVEELILEQVPETESLQAWIEDDNADMRVNLKPARERERESPAIQEALRPYFENMGEAEISFERTRTRGENQSPPVDDGRSGVIEIRGPEYEQINTIATNFSEVLEMIPGVRDVFNESEEGGLEIQFTLDRESAALLQVTPNVIGQSIQVAQRQSNFGTIEMEKGDDEIEIIFNQIPSDTRNQTNAQGEEIEGLRFEELKEVPVFAPSLGTTVPLSDLGQFEIARGLGNFQRENRERIGRLRFSTAPNTNYSEIEEQVQQLVDAYPAPAGYRLSLAGRSERISILLEEMQTMGVLALILVYMCIASLFESFALPLVVLLTVPLAAIGIIWSLILTETPFTEMAGMAVLFLIGVLPNSAILFTHFTTYLRREKQYPRTRAILFAGNTRLRPILMTVFTTILGILPMAFGDEEWVPFAVVIIGGLTSSTILTLIVCPGFYFIIEDIMHGLQRRASQLLAWRWVVLFWNPERRQALKENSLGYAAFKRETPPLQIEAVNLTRIYQPPLFERIQAMLPRAALPLKGNALGIVPAGAVDHHAVQNRNKALQSVSLQIENGVYGLLGPNGAGKSTLLRILVGIDQPTRGSLQVCGYDMKREVQRAQRHIGYLPQQFGVYSHMTAYQYLEYHALLKGIRNPNERRSAIHRALETVNLTDQIAVPVNQFSGGMMRRIGLAQILLKPPRVLVVDEPTAGLDPMERVRFRNLLSHLAQDRIVILSTHIVEDIAHACARFAFLQDGGIRFEGTPQQFIDQARGRLWEWTIGSEDEWRQLHQRYALAGQQHTADGIRVRLFAGQPPTEEAVAAEPTLEEAYLYYLEQSEPEAQTEGRLSKPL